MKKLICTTLIGLTSILSADLATDVALDLNTHAITSVVSDVKMPVSAQEKPINKSGFFYVRFAAAQSDFSQIDSLLPGLGIGYRRLAGDGAADISFSGIGRNERKNGRLFWTAPKASYIHYLKPDQKQSAYVGGGLAWGGLDNGRSQHFVGIIPSLTAGYEFVRKNTILSFAELNVSQPAMAVYKKGAYPGPVAECTVGIGF